MPEERSTAKAARKRLVASRNIARGELFTLDNLTTKRAATGVDPLSYWEKLGNVAARDYSEGDPIDD
jgi:sialic acid synthase SpsE